MAAMTTILIADSGSLLAHAEELSLQFACTFEHVGSEPELRARLAAKAVEILLIDLDFGDGPRGVELIGQLRRLRPGTLILPVIPAGQPQLIKQLLELDLCYYIHKPLDPQETTGALRRAHTSLNSRRQSPEAPPTPAATTSFHGMIGKSRIMRQLFDLIDRVAADDQSTVLIRGESGTGKEMVAKAIHARSGRRDKNFVPVNCAAIPDDLLESELFGYTKGAFTGATHNKPGRIQYADQGTLFLDEIGDMKGSLQAKLLRVLQEKEFEPVGAYRAIPINTRIVAATHCDLEQQVREGSFREDLYYRLSVVPLHIPALKERTEDIPELIEAFMAKFADSRGRERFILSPRALAALRHYSWRGNVRELENLIQHMTILHSGRVVQLSDLPEKFAGVVLPADEPEEASPETGGEEGGSLLVPGFSWEDGQIDFNELINDFETRLILQALRRSEGNKKEAARLLNLKRTTLLEKIKKKDLDRS
jgi:DNA-binding NtrC family response regulator